jgi:imidazolonepropionase-like amidohydrolase
MNSILRACFALPILVAASPDLTAQPSPQLIAITGVSVIPMDRERVIADQTVIIRDGRIDRIGPSSNVRVPPDARSIDGRGKYLIPGLAEMHAHIPGAQAPEAVTRRVLELFALNGVTQIRGMLGDPLHLQLKARAERGEVLSPRIIAAGPSLNGNSVPTPEAARTAVTAQKTAGYDLLKIHPGIKRDVFDTLAATADRVGIRFAGHVPLEVGIERAIAAKYWTVEHIDGFVEGLVASDRPFTNEEVGFFGAGLVDRVDMKRLPALVQAARRNGVWMTPTQVLMDNMAGDEPPEQMAQWPEMKYWLPNQLEQWVNNTRQLRTTPTFDAAHRAGLTRTRRTILKALHDGGVGFILGSDAPQMWNVPGFSTSRELQSLVRAGLTPFEALSSGTRNVATYLGNASEAGTVEQGKRADLVLLDANPLQDVGAVSRVAGVMIRGRWIAGEERERRLKELEIAR